MQAHEIFQRMSPALADRVFDYFLTNEKAGYRAAIEQLAPHQKLRPVFILRRPKPERHSWMKTALSRKASDVLASNMLQVWLVGTQTALLCAFLDSLGITHDERGMIEQLPPPPPAPAIDAAVDALLAGHEREIVAVYVQAFVATDDAPWPHLVARAATDPRLQPDGPASDETPPLPLPTT